MKCNKCGKEMLLLQIVTTYGKDKMAKHFGCRLCNVTIWYADKSKKPANSATSSSSDVYLVGDVVAGLLQEYYNVVGIYYDLEEKNEMLLVQSASDPYDITVLSKSEATLISPASAKKPSYDLLHDRYKITKGEKVYIRRSGRVATVLDVIPGATAGSISTSGYRVAQGKSSEFVYASSIYPVLSEEQVLGIIEDYLTTVFENDDDGLPFKVGDYISTNDARFGKVTAMTTLSDGTRMYYVNFGDEKVEEESFTEEQLKRVKELPDATE